MPPVLGDVTLRKSEDTTVIWDGWVSSRTQSYEFIDAIRTPVSQYHAVDRVRRVILSFHDIRRSGFWLKPIYDHMIA